MEERKGTTLMMAHAVVAALGLDRMLLQNMRRAEQDAKVTRTPPQASAVLNANGLRRERRRTGISARQQRIRRQRLSNADR